MIGPAVFSSILFLRRTMKNKTGLQIQSLDKTGNKHISKVREND
jgi:hypothetical protein